MVMMAVGMVRMTITVMRISEGIMRGLDSAFDSGLNSIQCWADGESLA